MYRQRAERKERKVSSDSKHLLFPCFLLAGAFNCLDGSVITLETCVLSSVRITNGHLSPGSSVFASLCTSVSMTLSELGPE